MAVEGELRDRHYLHGILHALIPCVVDPYPYPTEKGRYILPLNKLLKILLHTTRVISTAENTWKLAKILFT